MNKCAEVKLFHLGNDFRWISRNLMKRFSIRFSCRAEEPMFSSLPDRSVNSFTRASLVPLQSSFDLLSKAWRFSSRQTIDLGWLVHRRSSVLQDDEDFGSDHHLAKVLFESQLRYFEPKTSSFSSNLLKRRFSWRILLFKFGLDETLFSWRETFQRKVNLRTRVSSFRLRCSSCFCFAQ